MSKLKLAIALSTLIAVTGLWAVPFAGTAHGHLWRAETIAMQGTPVGVLVRLKQSSGRGLLTDVWIRGSGPFTFAVDTGAGVTLVSRSVINRAQLQTHAATNRLPADSQLVRLFPTNPHQSNRLRLDDVTINCAVHLALQSSKVCPVELMAFLIQHRHFSLMDIQSIYPIANCA